jgi:hypothetical protein
VPPAEKSALKQKSHNRNIRNMKQNTSRNISPPFCFYPKFCDIGIQNPGPPFAVEVNDMEEMLTEGQPSFLAIPEGWTLAEDTPDIRARGALLGKKRYF